MEIKTIINYNKMPQKRMFNSLNSGKKRVENNDINLSKCPISFYNKTQINFCSKVKLEQCKNYTLDNFLGCILGGAIGDAFGAPVEFMSSNSIKHFYGTYGIEDLECNEFGIAEFTDDTQMTIFTADGLLKSLANKTNNDEIPDYKIIYNSYLSWLETQKNYTNNETNDWILNIKELYSDRAPGTTCIYALCNKIPGSIENPINQSDGCGGLMRSSPIGLIYCKDDELAFRIGAESAALTHGSPEGYLPAGTFAAIISNLIQGKSIEESIYNAIQILKKYKYNEITLEILKKAINLAQTNMPAEKAITALGEGWSGHEALSIAIYSVLKSPKNFQRAIQIASNHDGDSDSTASVAGNIIGAALGLNGIPKKWTESIELKKEIQELTTDLYIANKDINTIKKKYKLPK